MVVQVSVLYPTGKFDLDYYLQKHMPLVGSTWTPKGLQKWEVVKVGPQPDGSPGLYQIQAILTWDSAESFVAASKDDGPKIFGDIANFTDVSATIIIGEVIASS